MDLKLVLKKANRLDFKNIAEIYSEEFSKSPYNEPWTLKLAIKKIKILKKYCDIYKVIRGKKVIGFIAINPNFFFPKDTAFGEEFAIKEEFQGKGVGTFVLRELEKIYKKRGYRYFVMLASKKGKAIKIYKKIGYKNSKNSQFVEKRL